jgi:hypothetical protein
VVSGQGEFSGKPIGGTAGFGDRLAGGVAAGLTAGAAAQVFYGGGQMSFSRIAADAFGNAVGQSLIDTLTDVLTTAGATGAEFEHQFNIAAKGFLLPGALQQPTLRLMNDRLGSLPSEALATTGTYLQSIGLKAHPALFLMDALESSATIINHYMDYTSKHPISPVAPTQLLRSPETPAWPYPNPYLSNT